MKITNARKVACLVNVACLASSAEIGKLRPMISKKDSNDRRRVAEHVVESDEMQELARRIDAGDISPDQIDAEIRSFLQQIVDQERRQSGPGGFGQIN